MVGEVPPNSIHPKERAELRAWLAENWNRSSGVWVVNYKKGTGLPRIDYAELVEECLCFGWIDSKPGAIDEQRSMNYIAPRKPGSNWSKLNKERAEALMAAGLMQTPGLARIEASKADGSWYALDGVESLELPEDLLARLHAYPGAEDNFRRFPRSVLRSILEWVLNAKKPETRAARIEETARLASENKRANQWRG